MGGFYDAVADGTVAMRAPADVTEVSVDVWRYAPEPKSDVWMIRPEHVAELQKIGFSLIDTTPPLAEPFPAPGDDTQPMPEASQ